MAWKGLALEALSMETERLNALRFSASRNVGGAGNLRGVSFFRAFLLSVILLFERREGFIEHLVQLLAVLCRVNLEVATKL